MLREILTLVVDNMPTQYYINFEKDRKRFIFQPTLQNKEAPSFTIHYNGDELLCADSIDISVLEQAKEKIKEILDNFIFDRF
jgi:hypothetical protein